MDHALTIRRNFTALCALCILVLAGGCDKDAGTDATRGVSADDALPDPDKFGVYHALVIGIDEYDAWPNLRFAERDANRIADVLESKYGFEPRHVTRLVGENATRSKVLNTLRTKLQAMTERDNLLIYYAGHGQLDSITEKGYWVPVDGGLDDVTSWIPFSELTELLSATSVKAKNVILLTDSCYGGAMRAGKTPGLPEPSAEQMERYYADLAKRASKRSRQVAASGGYEQVPDESMFAMLLTNALEDNDYQAVSLEWVFFSIYPHIKLFGQQEPAFARVLSGPDVDGQFVLVRSGAALPLAEAPAIPDVPNDGNGRGEEPGGRRTAAETVPERDAGPRIESFEVTPAEISAGEQVTVSWATADVSRVRITPIGTVPQSGSRQLQPAQSAEYTLEAMNSAGQTVTAVRSVTVRAQLPVIDFFDAAPDTISAGGRAELAWQVRGSASIMFLDQVTRTTRQVSARDRLQVSPSATTTYTLVAYNADRARVGRQVTVNVATPPPRIAAFTTNAARITAGGTATLSWQTDNASAVELSEVGEVAGSGSSQVSPLSRTTYVLVARNASGAVRQELTIDVTARPAQPGGIAVVDPRIVADATIVRDHRTAEVATVRDHRTAAVAVNPNTCRQGYVWREAYRGDVVCVTPVVRAQTAADNAQAAARWISGAYGPHICISGYVWREARDGDDVCVTPPTREQARADNAQAAARRIGG
jgi:Caspase domain